MTLLAVQQYNGVDLFLGHKDVTTILSLEFKQLNNLKKHTCITLNDGTLALLLGFELSMVVSLNFLRRRENK
jgi:hypothetical protein